MSGPVVMALSQRADGADIAEALGHRAESRHGATMALARILVAGGVPDGPWQAERNGVPVMRGPSLHRLAGLTITEDGGRERIIKWRAKVDSGVPDAPQPLAGLGAPAEPSDAVHGATTHISADDAEPLPAEAAA